ncbi:hypothetical protein L9F63_014345, partial [Diploptera punctata]
KSHNFRIEFDNDVKGKNEYKLKYVDLTKMEKSSPTKILFSNKNKFLTEINRGGPAILKGKQIGIF